MKTSHEITPRLFSQCVFNASGHAFFRYPPRTLRSRLWKAIKGLIA